MSFDLPFWWVLFLNEKNETLKKIQIYCFYNKLPPFILQKHINAVSYNGFANDELYFKADCAKNWLYVVVKFKIT